MEEHIRVNVVPNILAYYNRNDYKLIKCEIKPLGNLVDNWASTLYDLNLDILVENDGESAEEHYSLFMKSMLDDYTSQKVMENRKQFSNDIHVYKTVQPIFRKLLPEKNFKLFIDAPYAVLEDVKSEKNLSPLDGIVILENLRERGYKLGQRAVLDMDHCILALQQLGRWHALSLVVKELNPEQFHREILGGLEECALSKEIELNVRHLLTAPAKRLCKNAKYPQSSKSYQAVKILENECEDIVRYVRKLIASSERSKLSVLCHGDYCRNNILFKYDENEIPIDAVPIDYQYARYGSPGLDLSLLIFMNTGREIREKFFITLIQKYHESLVSTMEEILIREKKNFNETSSVIPSLDAILDDFRRHGAIGMIYAIFFVPWMMCSEEEVKNITKLSNDTVSKEYHDAAMILGGDAAAEAILEIFDTAITLDQISMG